ncbi:MAG: hypothetical protein E7208_05965 [Clostridium butyricum]|nr:hypothetical protein [Clostridium butyricum]
MIKIKLQKNKNGKIIFKLKVKKQCESTALFKRALMESKKLKENARYDYEVPLRFFFPIYKNYNKEKIEIDKYSLISYLEFSDAFDERYYTELEVTPKYMKKWREEGCPNIYKITINKETKEIIKEVVFKKPSIRINGGGGNFE